MKYKVGSHIPESEVLKRFKDGDGEIFLEIQGLEDALFRVTAGNHVYYKIEKEMIEGEELTLVEDLSHIKPKPFPHSVSREEAFREISVKKDQNSFGMEETTTGDVDSQTVKASDSRKEESSDCKELEEGQQVPVSLISKCKNNEYGGYTLRYNRFLYMVNSDYRVEIKNPDAIFSGDLKNETDVLEREEMYISGILKNKKKSPAKEIELGKGEILPPHLRVQCDKNIGGEGGNRIMIGEYLYFLDSHYRVTTKMKISYSGIEKVKTPPKPAAVPELDKLEIKEVPQKKLPVSEIVSNMVNTFKLALKKYKVSAEYFKENVLGPGNRNILIRAYGGDLAHLNDDTCEATSRGKTTILLKERGFTLFKAALVHELYIKSTLSDRGDNMKYFITHIIATEPDGTMGKFRDEMSLGEQKEMVEFFGSMADKYTDKTEIIRRVYRHLRVNVFEEYKELLQAGKELRFSGYLIMKLYQQTTRLDRGDGISIIQLSRDIMNYGQAQE